MLCIPSSCSCPGPGERRCPARHPLHSMPVTRSGFVCNTDRQHLHPVGVGSQIWGCKPCNYVACQECLDTHDAVGRCDLCGEAGHSTSEHRCGVCQHGGHRGIHCPRHQGTPLPAPGASLFFEATGRHYLQAAGPPERQISLMGQAAGRRELTGRHSTIL